MNIAIRAGLILATLLFPALASAGATGRILGHVLDAATRQPVAGAVVIVEGTTLSARTGTDGAYVIAGVPAGAYVVRVEARGARAATHRVTVASGQSVTADFRLTRLREEPEAKKDALRAPALRAPRGDAAPGTPYEALSPPVATMDCYTPPMSWPSPGDESYDAIEENAWFSTHERPLSTFSVDVDAASYSNVRRFLTQGQLPPADAVRIEELINYFDYDYPNPRGPHPFSIATEVAECPWNPGNLLVHVGLQGERLATEDLPPGNLVFLIDVSGSMDQPDKLPLLKSSFRMLVDQLRPEDRVAIVVYAGAAGLVLPSTDGRHREEILCAIDRLHAGGSTAGGAGLRLAYRVARDNFREGGNNRIILATDGDFNVGMSSDADMVRLIEEQRRGGVFLTVLGFGEGNLKDSKMEKIADKGNGHYAYIDNLMEARKVLVNELGATLLTIARDVKLQVEFNPARVASYRLIGYENRVLRDRDFDDDTKDAGEIGAGHSVTALYEVTPAGAGRAGRPLKYSDARPREDARRSDELLTVSFRYKRPDEGESRLLSVAVRDRRVRFDAASDDFRFAAAVAQFGMILRDSPERGDATMAGAIAIARGARGEDLNGYRAEFIGMAEIAEMLMVEVARER